MKAGSINQHHLHSLQILCILCLLLLQSPAVAQSTPVDDYSALTVDAAEIWGEDNIWLPSPKRWVQYEDDLGERSLVDFENGTVEIQLLIDADTDPADGLVLAHMRQGIRNLILSDAEDPLGMYVVLDDRKKKARTPSPLDKSSHAKKPAASHDLELDSIPPTISQDPIILDQIRFKTGKQVTPENVMDFAAENATVQTIRARQVKGKDGVIRQAVTVDFSLVPNHLEIRAKKYYPLVSSFAEQYDLDSSLIMAIIHTESMFNPRARSRAPAYGLMQLVPSTGAREAYNKLYGKNTRPSSSYLYNPKNNIELGVAYFDILKNRYMKTINDPASRTYCAVAAYNAGAANVGRAFVTKKSMNMASPVVNTMDPEDVYTRLVNKSLSDETRKYVRKVLTRQVLYASW